MPTISVKELKETELEGLLDSLNLALDSYLTYHPSREGCLYLLQHRDEVFNELEYRRSLIYV